ncbi:MAG: phosphonate ABC transporter substrate-binding protein, partial [Chroococcidiopsidaceae cyanobacterium CP_BM_RX_35]|nr:phosphonate ABC transporter substrate-binding protein [Chroococcidiopsidaceae cyanobacterium CP_BM_RX_35]
MPSRTLLLARFLLILWLPLSGCSQDRLTPPGKLTVGVVGYDTGELSVNNYERFQEYLAKQTSSVVELEPALNELNAVQQVRSKAWSIVFAPPGLAAIAIGTENYTPIFRMEGVN